MLATLYYLVICHLNYVYVSEYICVRFCKMDLMTEAGNDKKHVYWSLPVPFSQLPAQSS